MDDNALVSLPHLKQIFRQLSAGRHISVEDGALYQDMRKHEEAFKSLFSNLGFWMEKHPRGFFYFRGDERVGDRAALMALFMFILVDDLAGRGAPIEETIMAHEFAMNELPHLTAERYAMLMKDGGMADHEALEKLLKRMERLGFVSCKGGRMRFRTPTYRLLDLCLQIHQEIHEEEGSETA